MRYVSGSTGHFPQHAVRSEVASLLPKAGSLKKGGFIYLYLSARSEGFGRGKGHELIENFKADFLSLVGGRPSHFWSASKRVCNRVKNHRLKTCVCGSLVEHALLRGCVLGSTLGTGRYSRL
jgi:hypothetical protein